MESKRLERRPKGELIHTALALGQMKKRYMIASFYFTIPFTRRIDMGKPAMKNIINRQVIPQQHPKKD